MKAASTHDQFLDYTERTQSPEAKDEIVGVYYGAIRRAMEDQGTWNPEARFLDVGCGMGVYSDCFHQRGLKVTGVDIDEGLIGKARTRAAERNHDIHFEACSGETLPFEDNSFDIVFSQSLLEHVENWEACVEEWIRVLAPGGLLWLETTNKIHPRQWEYRYLPLYSWWPGFMKRAAWKLAKGPMPALANYSSCPAEHWFSFFQLRRFLEARNMIVKDRFDYMDTERAGKLKKMVRNVAVSGDAGRFVGYLLVGGLIILATKKDAAQA